MGRGYHLLFHTPNKITRTGFLWVYEGMLRLGPEDYGTLIHGRTGQGDVAGSVYVRRLVVNCREIREQR